jgi:pilus assembly protein Flp/PilA
MQRLILFCKDQRGATSSEYAVMAALVAGVIFAAVTGFGLSVKGLFENVKSVFP